MEFLVFSLIVAAGVVYVLYLRRGRRQRKP